jgi:hypothetical protein
MPRPKIQVGKKAGYVKKNKGYVYIEIDGKSYSAHRLAWFYVTGKIPQNQIDHINGKKADNRFENLREASNGQNRANTRSGSKHGIKGVRRLPWMKDGTKCWQAQITHNKKVHYLGCFYTKEEAHSAYCDAAKRLHGSFARF